MNAREQKQNSAPTAEEEMEYHQQRNDISELKEKTGSAYCHVTQIQINERPRLQKLQSMIQINKILKIANEAMAKTLKDKDLNLTEVIHLICEAAKVVIKEINGTGCYKSETLSPKTPPWVRCIQECINGIRKELSSLAEINRDKMKTQNTKRKRLLRKCRIEEKKILDAVIEPLKQKLSVKM